MRHESRSLTVGTSENYIYSLNCTVLCIKLWTTASLLFLKVRNRNEAFVTLSGTLECDSLRIAPVYLYKGTRRF